MQITMNCTGLNIIIDYEEFITILYWIDIFSVCNGKNFLYQHLLDQVTTNKNNKIPFDIKMYPIDDVMTDAIQIYCKFNGIEEAYTESIKEMSKLNSPGFSMDGVLEEKENFMRICEYILENYTFYHPEIAGIQKTFLQCKMSEYIKNEEYEKAAKARDLIDRVPSFTSTP